MKHGALANAHQKGPKKKLKKNIHFLLATPYKISIRC